MQSRAPSIKPLYAGFFQCKRLVASVLTTEAPVSRQVKQCVTFQNVKECQLKVKAQTLKRTKVVNKFTNGGYFRSPTRQIRCLIKDLHLLLHIKMYTNLLPFETLCFNSESQSSFIVTAKTLEFAG